MGLRIINKKEVKKLDFYGKIKKHLFRKTNTWSDRKKHLYRRSDAYVGLK